MKVSRVNPEFSKSKDQVLAITRICILYSNPYTFCVSDPPQTYINFKHSFKQNVREVPTVILFTRCMKLSLKDLLTSTLQYTGYTCGP